MQILVDHVNGMAFDLCVKWPLVFMRVYELIQGMHVLLGYFF
jgi:hypothetical protein